MEVLQDATGSLSYSNQAGSAGAAEIHSAFSIVFQSRFAAVLNTEEWMAAASNGKATQRDSIYQSNQRARLMSTRMA